MACGPIIDGVFLPEPPMEIVSDGGAHEIPYLMGSTSEDIVPPIVHKMAKGWARLQSDMGRCPSYAFSSTDSCREMTAARGIPRICGMHSALWKTAGVHLVHGTVNCRILWCGIFLILSARETRTAAVFPRWLPMEKGQNRVMRFGDHGVAMGGVSVARLNHTMRTKTSVGE